MQRINISDSLNSNDLKTGEFYLLDAPGINGMGGSDNQERFIRHVEAGGVILHKMSISQPGGFKKT